MNIIDLNTFKPDHFFYGNLNLAITIKSFDLQAIRKRYIETKNKESNRTGSVERRKVTTGGVAQLKIDKGTIKTKEVILELPEPRGIDIHDTETLSFSSENKAYILKGGHLTEITNPWFSYIHTVQFNEDASRLLISSSGFDSIFEYDCKTLEPTFEWFAWENGYNKGRDPKTGRKFYITRKKNEAQIYQKQNDEYLLINDPLNQVLPTAKRAAFINSVKYNTLNSCKIIATLFHEGAVIEIDKRTTQITKILNGLTNPHGGGYCKKGAYATSTRSGEFVLNNEDGKSIFSFQNLPGKPEHLEDFEWIQNSIIKDDIIISIDSNRNSFIIFNPKLKLIDVIPYDLNWAVQDISIGNIDDAGKALLNGL
ncbi:MAG: hypothetical protein K9G70_11560 [Prolixibacteraceae bacterium]|nr:hypothetical protein [Prolixibacteraceae bacterium]